MTLGTNPGGGRLTPDLGLNPGGGPLPPGLALNPGGGALEPAALVSPRDCRLTGFGALKSWDDSGSA